MSIPKYIYLYQFDVVTWVNKTCLSEISILYWRLSMLLHKEFNKAFYSQNLKYIDMKKMYSWLS